MKKILFVCTGNTCRSPMAQGLCDKICREGNFDIISSSAGIATMSGLPVSDNAKAVCKEFGVDISYMHSTSVYDVNLNDFDVIFTMSENHKSALVSLGADKNKIKVLGSERGGISDPFGGDLDVYRKCRDEIYNAVKKSVKEL